MATASSKSTLAALSDPSACKAEGNTCRISALQDALMRAELRLKDAEEEMAKHFLDRECGAEATLLAEQVTLAALKAAYEVEKARLIATVKPAPADSLYTHPTPKQLWEMEGACPEEFSDCARFIFMPKDKLLKKVPWARELEECIKAGGCANLSINNCLAYSVASIEDGWLIGPSGGRTPILFDRVAKELVLADVGANGAFFNLTGIDAVDVSDHEGVPVGTQYIHYITPKGKIMFRQVNEEAYEDHYQHRWVDDMIKSGQLVLAGGS